MRGRSEPEDSALSLFSESVSHEWQRSLRGLAQLADREGTSAPEPEPQAASDLLGQHAQMFGKAVGGLLPTLVIAAGSRYAFGRILAHDALSAENALLKRTPIGLSAAEAGMTGFLSGSLLSPTEGAAKEDPGQLLYDRLQSGVRSGAEFALMSAGSIGLGKLASTQQGVALGAERLMRIGAVNGLVSGAVGGFANVEVDSLARNGRLNFDQRELGKSIYEMSLFGAVFGFGASMLGRAHNASTAVARSSGEQFALRERTGDLRFSRSIPDGPALAEPVLTEPVLQLERLDSYPVAEQIPRLHGAAVRMRVPIDLEPATVPAELTDNSPGRTAPAGEKASAVDRPVARFSGEQSLIRLNELFGEDSQTMQRLKAMKSYSSLVNFAELAEFFSENTEQRVSMFRKLAEQDTDSSKLAVTRLKGVEGLSGYFGESSQLMKRLFELENGNMFIFGDVNNFIKGRYRFGSSDRAGAAAVGEPVRAELVKELLLAGFDSRRFSEGNLTLFESLVEHFPVGSKELKRLMQLDQQGARLSTVLEPLRVDKGANVPAVKEMLLSGELTKEGVNEGNGFLRSMARLTLERNLSDHAKAEGLMRVFQGRHLSGSETLSLSAFVAENPEKRLALVEQQSRATGQEQPQLTVERLQAIESLSDDFAAKPEVLAKILRSETGGTRLDELAEFIAQDPDANKRIVEEVVARDVTDKYGEYLDYGRLSGLKSIYERFGAQSDTTRRILEKESEELDLAGLGEFVGESESNAALVKELVGQGADTDELADWRLNALAAMIKVSGEGSSLITKAIKLEPEGLLLSDLSLFIQGDEKTESHSLTDAKVRAEFVERLIDEGVRPAKLSLLWLRARFYLGQEFGEGSPTLQSLLAAQAENRLSLPEIAGHLMRYPKDGPFVQKLFDSGLTSVSAYEIGALKDLDQMLQTDRQALGRLLQLQNVISLSSLRAVLSEAPDNLRPVVLQLLKDGASDESFSAEALKDLSAFNSMFGPDLTMGCSRLVSGWRLRALTDFVAEQEEVRRRLLEDVLKENPSAADLDVRRLEALLELKQAFHDAPQVMTLLREVESPTSHLSSVSWFLKFAPDGGKEQIQAMVAEGASSSLFNSSQMAARYLLERAFVNEAPRIKPILAIGDNLYAPEAVLHFLRTGGAKKSAEESVRRQASGQGEEPSQANGFTNSYMLGVRERAETLEAFLAMGQRPEQLAGKRLGALDPLSTVYGVDETLFRRFFELEKEGLNLETVGEFVSMDPTNNGKVLREEVEKGTPVKFFTMARLLDRAEVEKLSEYFPSGDAVMNHLEKLNKEGLSGSRARQYVSENPAERAPMFERLVQEQAGVDRFRALMSLQVLPAKMAYALMEAASHGGMPVPVLLSNLRDWRAGRHFRELLMEHVANEGDLSAPAIERVVERAKEAALAADGERLMPNPLPVMTEAQQAALPSATADLANVLRAATDRINKRIPAEKHIVLLGRDMWQFLPLLKAQGRSVQYFLWSGLQNLADTGPHWLKEVPPNSVVLDSGYKGTIIDNAKAADPTVSGFLLQKTRGLYEQLLINPLIPVPSLPSKKRPS